MILLRRVVCHSGPSVNRLSIDRPPPLLTHRKKKTDPNRLNTNTGTKNGWFAGPLLHVPARQSALVCAYRVTSAVHSRIHEHLSLLLFVQKLPTVNLMAPCGKGRQVKERELL